MSSFQGNASILNTIAGLAPGAPGVAPVPDYMETNNAPVPILRARQTSQGAISNPMVTHSYVQSTDASEIYKEHGVYPQVGDAMFMSRYPSEEPGTYEAYPIYMINHMLKEGWEKWRQQWEDETNALPNYGEDEIMEYDWYMTRGKLGSGITVNYENEDAELVKLYKIAMKEEFWWATKLGILNRFNFLGILVSTESPAGNRRPLSREHEHVDVFGVIVYGETHRAVDYWGNQPSRTNLFFVLKRENDESPYQIVPWASPKYRTVPLTVLNYQSWNKLPMTGHAWHVGSVHQANQSRYKRRVAGQTRAGLGAAGINVVTPAQSMALGGSTANKKVWIQTRLG